MSGRNQDCLKLSCVDSLFEAFSYLNKRYPSVALSLRLLLIEDDICNIVEVNERYWYSWYVSYEKQNDPRVLKRIDNIIEFSKENPLAFHFLNRYYTCIGNFEEADKWIL